MSSSEKGFFFELTPEKVLAAVESSGLLCTGRCMSLNSFENRVYDVELETEEVSEFKHLSANRRVVKFYRPGRWTREQILEEHQFLLELQDAEIPVIAPLSFPDGSTLQQTPESKIWFAIFPKVGGRAPDELTPDQLIRVGRLLGRIHNVGASKAAQHRVTLNPMTYGINSLRFLQAGKWIPVEFETRFVSVVESICEKVEPWFQSARKQRVHGDCHLGNLLWSPSGPFFLDFDDMVIGPPVQDLWLLVPGRDAEAIYQRNILIEGYEEIRSFDRSTLRLIEPLRALRFVHYAAWIARRWEDPAFPQAFPHFGTHQYWSRELKDLEDQLKLIQEISS
jgi:Ser/Thr protein kinase RdoA (MazF antagonist)